MSEESLMETMHEYDMDEGLQFFLKSWQLV
jgi:hypothetical protein